MPTAESMALPVLWLVRILALGAAIASFWLTLQKWLGPRVSLAGCGELEGCATLLDSRWSLWFSIPVTLLATSLWLAVLLLTLPTVSRWLGRTSEQLLAACAMLLIAGAAWFGTLMLFIVKTWCPWCAALHCAAAFVGLLLLHSTWRASRQGEVGLFSAAGQAGIAGAALLVLGQVFGKAPDTHLITEESTFMAALPPPAGTVSFLNNSLTFSPLELPLLGAEDAAHIFAGFSDYTCPACRSQYSDLKALLKASPDRYAVIVLPTPLDRSCNPYLAPNWEGNSSHACALATLSLAFWRAAPEFFPAFHDFLMSSPLPLDPATARLEAARLAPTASLVEAAPWIAKRLAANVEALHRLSPENSKLPKLLLRGDIVLHGSTSSRERFFEIIEETFAPPSEPAIPVSTAPRGASGEILGK